MRMVGPPRKRHGIVSGIIIPPYFCQPPAALDCDKSLCVGPVLSVPDSSAPSPPGPSGSGLSHGLTPILGQRKLVLFVFGVCHSATRAGRNHNRHRGVQCACAKRAHPAILRQGRIREFQKREKISAATYMPRRASGLACRDYRPGRKPPRHPRLRGRYFPAARSSCLRCHSSRPPSAGCALHCGR
jgi:hypothetical protein